MLRSIDVTENIKTNIVRLSVNASEPKLSAEINQALIEKLDEHQRDYNRIKTSEAKHFIQERIKETEKDLIAAEEKLRDFMDRNRRIENSPALQLNKQRLTREVTVLTGVFTTLKQQLETTKIEEVKESDYVIIIDPPEMPLQKSAPNKRIIMILSFILGVGMGITAAFIIDTYNSKSKKQITKIKTVAVKSLREMTKGNFY